MSELTDVDSVRQFMQKSLSDKLQDEDLETLIIQASPAIERRCSREFFSTPNATRSFEFTPECNGVLNLTPYELRDVSAVVVDPDLEGGTTLTTSQYQLKPFPARDGTFFGLRLANLPVPNRDGSLPFFTRRVDVTGDWGMTSVPDDIQHWANVTVEAWAQLRREGVQPSESGLGLPPIGYPLPLPVAQALDRDWQRPEPLV